MIFAVEKRANPARSPRTSSRGVVLPDPFSVGGFTTLACVHTAPECAVEHLIIVVIRKRSIGRSAVPAFKPCRSFYRLYFIRLPMPLSLSLRLWGALRPEHSYAKIVSTGFRPEGPSLRDPKVFKHEHRQTTRFLSSVSAASGRRKPTADL